MQKKTLFAWRFFPQKTWYFQSSQDAHLRGSLYMDVLQTLKLVRTQKFPKD